MPDHIEAAITRLRSEWPRISDLARAQEITTILATGVSGRTLARKLQVSESLIRHLKKLVLAAPLDQWRIGRRAISTREAVRRVQQRGTTLQPSNARPKHPLSIQ